MDKYEREYEKLNVEQKRAVDAIDGPVLVIAGPGTGKTQLLSMRVANILRTTDTDAQNILCLTFTNKAAKNMKDRLITLIGSEARFVHVKTFHSFAAEIMNSYPEYFWNGATLTNVPETAQIEIIESILKKLPHDNPLALKFAGSFTTSNSVLKSIGLAKEAGLTPQKLEALIAANLSYIKLIEQELVNILSETISNKRLLQLKSKINGLPNQKIDSQISPLVSLKTKIVASLVQAISLDENTNKATNTSKWKNQWVQNVAGERGMHKEIKRNNWWLELAKVYSAYRDNLHLRGFYDYSDMLIEVISQLEQNPELLADVQENFLYLLIDEFQDSNAAQLRLAHLVANSQSANGMPNIMAVGDDGQSIFAFNGAELKNMYFFERTYKGVKEIVLTSNYRSNQAVIDASEAIIKNAKDRLSNQKKSLNKKLISEKEKRKGEIIHYIYPTKEHQTTEVVELIANKWQSNNLRSKKDTIAVLARNHDTLIRLSAELLQKGVPINYEKQSNIFDSEVVQQIILFSKIIVGITQGNRENVNSSLVSTLQHPMWGIDPIPLWQLAIKKPHDWLSEMASSNQILFKQIAKYFFDVASIAERSPLSLIMEYIIGLRPIADFPSPIKKHFAQKEAVSHNYLTGLSAIQLVRQLVKEFTISVRPRLKDFVSFIEINELNKKMITDESPFVTDNDAVNLYTVHKAKGLEFDTVFIVDAIDDNWKPKPSRFKPPANLPLQPPLETDDDYARLLYVATSRAKHSIIVTSYELNSSNSEVSPTPLLHGAMEQCKILNFSKDENIQALENAIKWPRLSIDKEKALLAPRLTTFSINVSNLINFLDVSRGGPSLFLRRNLLQLPEAKSTIFANGTAMHRSLELAQKLINSEKFEISPVIEEFKNRLKEEGLPDYEEKQLIDRGVTALTNFFSIYQLPKGSKPEQRLKEVVLTNATIDGKLDRIDILNKDSLNIVDYKTGTPLSSFQTTNKSLTVKAWRQKTQLIFYSLLAQNHPRFSKYKKITGEMVYVNAESTKTLTRKYSPTRQETERLALLIERVWQKIMNLDLPDVTSYPDGIEGIHQFEEDLLSGKI